MKTLRRRALLLTALRAAVVAVVVGSPRAAEAGLCCYWGPYYVAGCEVYCDCCYPGGSNYKVFYTIYCRNGYDCADNYCGTTDCFASSGGCSALTCSGCQSYQGSCA